MDLIYKIYSLYLYDNQLDHEFIILNNRTTGYSGHVNWDLPYYFSGYHTNGALNRIRNMDKSLGKEESIQIMSDASNREKLPFIKNDGFLTLVKIGKTENPLYSIYDIFWNETKSGINIHDFEVCHIWKIGETSYSSYRIWEHKEERQRQIREYNLENLLK